MTDLAAPEEAAVCRVRAAFESVGCAQMADAAPEFIRPLKLPLAARNGIERVCGPIFPVVTQDDMLPCLQALAEVPAGWVLFIHNETSPSEALVGDIFAASAATQRLGGIVVNGAVRDLVDLASIEVAVFSTEITFVSARTTSIRAQRLPHCLEIDGLDLTPGTWLFGDPDGFLLVDAAHVSAVFTSGTLLRDREEQLKASIRAGQTLAELTGLHEFLDGDGELRFSP